MAVVLDRTKAEWVHLCERGKGWAVVGTLYGWSIYSDDIAPASIKVAFCPWCGEGLEIPPDEEGK